MEHLRFVFKGTPTHQKERKWCIVGVVASGNLEVLIETGSPDGDSLVTVATVIAGWADTWEFVLKEFVIRNGLSNVNIAINDCGASPSIVNLRLDQALLEFREDMNA